MAYKVINPEFVPVEDAKEREPRATTVYTTDGKIKQYTFNAEGVRLLRSIIDESGVKEWQDILAKYKFDADHRQINGGNKFASLIGELLSHNDEQDEEYQFVTKTKTTVQR